MPEDLWKEVCNIVQEAVTKTIPKKKKCNKAKWLSELRKKERERENRKAKKKSKDISICIQNYKSSKGITKASLSEQCKEIEEKNRMGETRDLFRKIIDT